MFTIMIGGDIVNTEERDILLYLKKYPFLNQRVLSDQTGYSLGKVNQSLKGLIAEEFLDSAISLTPKAENELKKTKPKNAIILAAGYGMRMIPMNSEIPKGLIKVDGEPLIERLISQLRASSVHDITVIVGFMKESYEYLIDLFGVKLVVNMSYAEKNNLHSLLLVSEAIDNSYILPCDIWCEDNPFNEYELYSWYSVCDFVDDESYVRINRKQELVRTNSGGNQMIGISYISYETAPILKSRLLTMAKSPENDGLFWEDTLFSDNKMIVRARVLSALKVFEINTYEQLRELSPEAKELHSLAVMTICEVMKVSKNDIEDITVVKKGMTNRSFCFTVGGDKYFMRIPGAGTDKLINRQQEFDAYQTIRDFHFSDNIIFMDPKTGYKITEYWADARVCDPACEEDIKKCMKFLKDFHHKKLSVKHKFNIFEKIKYYESLWQGKDSCYQDYRQTQENILSLKKYIDDQPKQWSLTHIDAVPDNFIFINGDKTLRLIDWEYAAMQDPHVDIAMFIIYSLYEREQAERLIDSYFDNACPLATRRKIYAYVAMCGLLWSNWCEYKRHLGVEFGEYSLRQYRYAKDYFKLFSAFSEK